MFFTCSTHFGSSDKEQDKCSVHVITKKTFFKFEYKQTSCSLTPLSTSKVIFYIMHTNHNLTTVYKILPNAEHSISMRLD